MEYITLLGGLQKDHRKVIYVLNEVKVSFTLKSKAKDDIWNIGNSIKLETTKGTYRPKRINGTTFLHKTRNYKILVSIYQETCNVGWEIYNKPKLYKVIRKGTVAEVLYSNLKTSEKIELKERYRANYGDKDETNTDLTI